MQNSIMVGKEVVGLTSNDNGLQKSEGENASLKPKDDFQRRPHRPARFRLIDKNGEAWGTFGSPETARAEAERLWPGEPANTSDEDQPNGWFLESTKFKVPKIRRLKS